MGVIEKNIAIILKDKEGNQILCYPFTIVDNVEGAVSETQLQNYVTKTDLSDKLAEYVTSADLLAKDYIDITTADGKYLAKTGKAESAKTADSVNWDNVQNKPTNLSDFKNDIGYITEIPSEYVTESELELKNYATKQEIPTQYLKDVTVLNDKLTFSTNNLPKTITVNNVAYAKQAGNMFWNGILDPPSIPTKTSDLSNDNNFITSSELEPYALTETVNTALAGKVDYGALNNYVTKTELNNKGYLTSIPAEYVTETELSLKGFLIVDDLQPYAKSETVNQQLSQKVNTSEMVNYVTYTSLSKQGFITNDELNSRNYLTSVPSEYVTETELESKSYATVSQLESKVDDTEVANKANKIPRYSADGHLILPSGVEIW